MNDDVEPLAGWWPPLRAAIDAGIAVACPLTVDGAMRFDFPGLVLRHGPRRASRSSRTRPGQFFDPALVLWYQDTDLLHRLRDAGRPPLVVESARIRHGLSQTVASEDPELARLDQGAGRRRPRAVHRQAPRRGAERSRRLSAKARPLDVLVVGAGFAGTGVRARDGRGLRPARPGDRPPPARRRQRPRRPRRARRAHPHLRAAYLPHQRGQGDRFLSRFTEWRPYEHRVWAEVDGQIIPLPINRTTVQTLHRVELARRPGDRGVPRLVGRAALTSSGTPRTRSWPRSGATCTSGCSAATPASSGRSIPSELHASVCARLPGAHQRGRPLLR